MTSNSLATGDRELRLLTATMQSYVAEIDELARRARQALDFMTRPGTDVRGVLSEAARRSVPRWHFEMLNDTERSDVLAKAIAAAVKPGDRVLDIGAGTGLLAMIAAQSGAAEVISCEGNPLLAEIAREVISAHGYADVITVLPTWSTNLDADRDLGGPVDLIVSEIVDCGLLGEGLLPTVRHAREHLLAPGGRMVPQAARLSGQLIESQAAAGLNRVDFTNGFDLSALNMVATSGHFPLRTGTRPHRMLSSPVELASFDLFTDPLDDQARQVQVRTSAVGTAHGLLAWFELDLGNRISLSNSPDNSASHWGQAFIPFDRPVEVGGGEQLTLAVSWQDGRLFAVPANPRQ